jgi:hypothetical protein
MRIHSLLSAVAAVLLAAMASVPDIGAQPAAANPASRNCVAKSGSVAIERNPKGAEYGVCIFPDNRQCEEWALLRGECPAGGIRVTGYATAAARYCAITGGTYRVTSASNTRGEQGSCTFPNGRRCDASAYFEGSCVGAIASGARTIRARFGCSDGRSIDATFVSGASSSVKLVLSDGRTLTLPQAPSASGARYAGANESIVFWNKGNTAFIEEKGKMTYEGCVERR